MKKTLTKLSLLLSLCIPYLVIAQHKSTSLIGSVAHSGDLVSQLAQLLPMGINPYATVFVTSILSKMGIHNDFIATNPFFDSWLIVSLFGFLFLFTSLVGTVFKTNKATAAIGLADNYLSSHAAIIINIIVIVSPLLFFDANNNGAGTQEAGFFSLGLKTLLVLIISIYFLVVVTTVRFFIDILIFLSPIPFIDSILEIVKIVITILFVLISVFYPTFSVILSVLAFIISLMMYRKSVQLVNKTKYLFVFPILNLFKNKEKLLTHNDLFSFCVYLKTASKKFKKGSVVRLVKKEGTVYLVKDRFLFSSIEETIDISNFTLTKKHLSSTVSNDDKTKVLLLNRSYHKYLQEIKTTFDFEIPFTEATEDINSQKGLLSRAKNMFNKNDINELKLID
ncbi:hypothetical protein [Tenacibaculum amylolyticum]|uniref:hypothetical protein n=1 Tax=Tenacibaculum amylolyticum TaxID=104269 RepID=UPI0038930631